MSTDSLDRILIRGDRLRSAREKRGLSQRALAKILNLGINQINRYENGINDPTSAILVAIAQELRVSTDYLLGLSDLPMGYSSLELGEAEQRLVDAYLAGDSATVVKLMSARLHQLEGGKESDE